MQTGYQPNILWAFSKTKSDVPILKERMVSEKTLIYVCQEGVCQLPVTLSVQALGILK
jgi:hypothetical protein